MTLDHHKFDESKYTLVDAKTRLILTEELKSLQAKADMAEKLMEALQFYADKSQYKFQANTTGPNWALVKLEVVQGEIVNDAGETARTALQAWNELKERA